MTKKPQPRTESVEFEIHGSIAHRLDVMFKSTHEQKRKDQENEFNALVTKHKGKIISLKPDDYCANANIAFDFFKDVRDYARRHQDVYVAFQCAIPAEEFFNRALNNVRYPQ